MNGELKEIRKNGTICKMAPIIAAVGGWCSDCSCVPLPDTRCKRVSGNVCSPCMSIGLRHSYIHTSNITSTHQTHNTRTHSPHHIRQLFFEIIIRQTPLKLFAKRNHPKQSPSPSHTYLCCTHCLYCGTGSFLKWGRR